jgi:hypothetical protein
MPSKPGLDKIRFTDIASLEQGQFSFVNDAVVRTNVAIYVQYVNFLLSLDEEYDLGSLTYSIYKDVVVHSAHVVESLLYYKLRCLIDSGRFDETKMMGSEKKYTNEKLIHDLGDGQQIVACRVKRVVNKLHRDTKFTSLNKAGKKCGLLDDRLYRFCDEIREMRNKVHLAGLVQVDDQYSKSDLEDLFSKVKAIIERIRTFD